MTRKHFKAVADAIRGTKLDAESRSALARQLAHVFATLNPRFDRARFLEACVVEA